jgi:hypothetical protein
VRFLIDKLAMHRSSMRCARRGRVQVFPHNHFALAGCSKKPAAATAGGGDRIDLQYGWRRGRSAGTELKQSTVHAAA